MTDDRIRTIYRHLNANVKPTELFAFGVQNPMKAIAHKSNYSETKKPSKPRIFRYTNNCSKLSREQRLFYEENGFIVMRKLISEDNLERYKHRFQEICDGEIDVPALTVMKDVSCIKDKPDERIINKIQDFSNDEVLFEYCMLPEILDYVECFCGPNIKSVHTMLINKPPDTGAMTSRHPLHQDLHYFPFRPADKIVCAWTAMERVTRLNGCLVVIPGSHRDNLLEHEYPDWKGGVNKLYHGVTNLSQEFMERRIHLEMEAGDTVFFHPVLIHGSGANRSNGFRKAISCHFAASECDYIDVRGTSQENLANEVLKIAKKKGAELDDIKYVWQFKSRLVRGSEVTL